MNKFVCTVCGYIHNGDSAPERCPLCRVPAEKFRQEEVSSDSAANDPGNISVLDMLKQFLDK